MNRTGEYELSDLAPVVAALVLGMAFALAAGLVAGALAAAIGGLGARWIVLLARTQPPSNKPVVARQQRLLARLKAGRQPQLTPEQVRALRASASVSPAQFPKAS